MKPKCIVGMSRYHDIAVFDMNNKLLFSGQSHRLKRFTKGMKILRFYVSDQCDLSKCISLSAPINIIAEEVWRKYFVLNKVSDNSTRQKVLKIIPEAKLSISSSEAEAALIGLIGIGRKLS